MAAKQNTRGRARRSSRKNAGRVPAKYLFWLAFFLLMTGLFLVNWKHIQRTLAAAGLLEAPGRTEDAAPAPPEGPARTPDPVPEVPRAPAASPAPRTVEPEPQPAPVAAPPVISPPPPGIPEPGPEPVRESGAARRESAGQPPARAEDPPTARRSIYFIRVERDGSITQSQVTRNLPVSDSPLLDALNALMSGPTGEERRAGLLSMIPEGSRVLGAWVRDATAFINFSEEFQFNPYGVEGWAAQLRQIVWTATEFSTVKNVQVLIEGQRHDYLGEGIRIGSPVRRDNF
ncbi:MAG: GerMN domain-containing protein [Spirochaetaceae bacterium]|nr:GerMN domain-containing protein [Spirochaetaceae bacterium]